MSKRTYLVFHTDGSIEKTSTLDDEIYEGVDSGHIRVVDPKKWKFLSDEDWEDIPEREIEEDDVDDDQDFDEDESYE